jgi:outer membrane protein assembly factor BamB
MGKEGVVRVRMVDMDVKRFIFPLAALFLFTLMRGDKTVFAASPDLIHGNFQLQSVVVDDGKGNPVHKLFLLDTETGKVWRYQPVVVNANADGTVTTLFPESFVPVSVVQSK